MAFQETNNNKISWLPSSFKIMIYDSHQAIENPDKYESKAWPLFQPTSVKQENEFWNKYLSQANIWKHDFSVHITKFNR